MSKDSEHDVNRRQYFRLRLPEKYALVVVIEGVSFRITELAERSLRVAETNVPHRDGWLEGVLHWSDGRQSRIRGRLGLRKEEGHRIILDVTGISTGDVIGEQRRLLKRFPTRRQDG